MGHDFAAPVLAGVFFFPFAPPAVAAVFFLMPPDWTLLAVPLDFAFVAALFLVAALGAVAAGERLLCGMRLRVREVVSAAGCGNASAAAESRRMAVVRIVVNFMVLVRGWRLGGRGGN